MTEDEAKTRLCPTDAPTDFCIGSGCMAWRTERQWLDNAQETPSWVSFVPYGFQSGPGQEREDGFCGLVSAHP